MANTVTRTYTGSLSGWQVIYQWIGKDAKATSSIVNISDLIETRLYQQSGTQKNQYIYGTLNQTCSCNGKTSYKDDYYYGDYNGFMMYCPRNTWKSPASVSDGNFLTSDLFNSNNPTVRTLNVGFSIPAACEFMGTKSSADPFETTNITAGSVGNVATITLDAPPSFSNDPLAFDTPDWIYAGLTTASVNVSSLSAKYGGYIVEAKLKIGNQEDVLTGDLSNPLTSGTLSILLGAVGTFTPTLTVTDSRGQVKTKNLSDITVLGYTIPSINNLSVERTLNTGAPNDEGTYGVVSGIFIFTDDIASLDEPGISVSGLPSVSAVWYKTRNSSTGVLSDQVDWTDTSDIDSGTVLYGLIASFQINESYVINITPIDSQGTGTSMSVTLPTAFYTIDFLAGGHGIAFGKPATQSDLFECDLNTQFNKESYFKDGTGLMRALFDFVRPVGSAYSTVDPTFDPNNVWGGTWEKLPEGYILLSGSDNGSYVVGDDTSTGSGYKEYGSNTHTLTLNEIPSHNHNSKTLTGTMRVMAWYNTSVSGIVSVSNKSANKNPGTGTNEGACTYTVNATHTHDSQGGGQAHSIMQKSIAVYWWIRTA